MKIKEISRTVSGFNYDNIKLTADIQDGEDFVAAAIELDRIARMILLEIENRKDNLT